ncbi:Methyltransferase domain-containing protein [Halogranum gelatinilyticum]|uniref:Methyltransferase domain-containing protein n=1 Tax=Halogranum gelatinilyticum TaxID=660521 RepID=A0A1G9R7U9_9EURY|nr:class I SAM-dependent methyltransferase [Halogranum gelatinilyticum]SDM19304.1 Methyltransferase domain-containing protein [Halogranum gelatinilyticum]
MTDRSVIRAGYDELAEDYQRARGDRDHDEERLADLAGRLPSSPHVLDAGCGDGRPVSTWFDDSEVASLDFSRTQLELAREQLSSGWLTQGDMTALPFETDSFDAVCAFNSFIHIPDSEHGATLREFRRVLRPGGWLLFTTGCSEWEGRNPDWLETGVAMEWSILGVEQTHELLEERGFEVEETWVYPDKLDDGNDDSKFPLVLAQVA